MDTLLSAPDAAVPPSQPPQHSQHAPQPHRPGRAPAAPCPPVLPPLAAALAQAREDERRRLTQEVHDDLGQLLGAMQIGIDHLRSRLGDGPNALREPVDNLQGLLDAMLLSMRRIVAGLPPKALEDGGLCTALRQLATGFAQRQHLGLRLACPRQAPALDPRHAALLYRVAQESLNNIAKHAEAHEVQLRLACGARTLSLTIRDDGAGLAPGDLDKPGCSGLASMRQRCAALGAQLRIRSTAGAGTTVQVRVPLP